MSENNFDIAIVGIAGEFPGAKTIQTFWQNLVQEKECLHHFSQAELTEAGVPHKEFTASNYVPVAGIVEDIDLFAAEFFGYSPRDAAFIDPQQRKLLELAWHALEDAGINPARYEGTVGVYVGSSLNTYLLNNILSHPDIYEADDLQQILFGNGADYLATRIAYLFNLRGPALNIQTACSTSLVAVHEACQSLLSFRIDAAIAGGVSIAAQKKGYLYSVDGMLSPDGHCRPFSEQAEGTVFSSGAGLVVLKRLSDALEQGDAIYAVIKGSAINNDGRQKVGYTAPSVDGQAEVIALAQGMANVTPEQITYVETHGTATALGDLIELSALQKVFADTEKKQFCALGSIKSNIGHLDIAAGIAGLIKATLALHHKQLPPTLHCQQPSKKVSWTDSAFYVNQELIDWKEDDIDSRYAGVSSFGIGGTNAHVILSGVKQEKQTVYIHGPALLTFSAKTLIELQAIVTQFKDYCLQNPSACLHGVARTLQQGRSEFNFRTAIVVTSLSDAVDKITHNHYDIVTCEQALETIQPKSIENCDASDLQFLQEKWLQGHLIDWALHYTGEKPTKVRLPLYPFNRSRYWIQPYQADGEANKKLNIEDWFYLPSWQKSLLPVTAASVKKETILFFAGNSTFHQDLQADLTKQFDVITVQCGTHFQKVSDHHFIIDITALDDYIHLLTGLKSSNSLPRYFLHALTLTEYWQETSELIFAEQQQHGLLSLIHFSQAWEKIAADYAVKITVLTNRINNIANEEKTEPHKAPLLAAVKVIPKEFVKIETQLIDIDAISHRAFSAFQFGKIRDEILKEFYDQEEIVYRHSQRWIRDYTAAPLLRAGQSIPDENQKVIFITGGLGQLGLDIADYFSKQKNYKIALLSRTVLPPEKEWEMLAREDNTNLNATLERLNGMRKLGCEVKAFSADVGDFSGLNQVVKEVEATMGPITGVIHAAGETVNGIISLKQQASLNESYRAKVFGTYHLHALFKHKKMDFFILCSSMNAIIGGLGQLDNTAANAFIDYMAEFMNQESGMPIFAINWGAINTNRPMKVNVLHQFTDLSTEHKKNRMTDDEVNEVYDRLLANPPQGRVVISTIDMKTVLKSWNRVASIDELAKDRKSYQQQVVRIISAEECPRTEVESWISDKWQQLLGLGSIGLKDNFFALGGHSLAAVQFMTKVKETYHLKIHVMTLYELPTLEQFSGYLEQQLKQKKVVK